MTMKTEPARRTVAVWRVRHRWIAAVLCALVPVVFTAVGSAVGQVLELGDTEAVWVIAAAVAVSALLGLLVMAASRQRYSSYGYRRPVNVRRAWWFVPPLITMLLVLLTGGVAISGQMIAATAVLVIAVAINEETWFRGIVLALLRPAGIRTAIIGSSALFGVLHLANLAGGADLAGALLQVAFAVLFGVIAAELAVLTGSLWPAIGWHAAWDFVSYLGGDAATPLALVGVGIACVVMLVYAVILWRPSESVNWTGADRWN